MVASDVAWGLHRLVGDGVSTTLTALVAAGKVTNFELWTALFSIYSSRTKSTIAPSDPTQPIPEPIIWHFDIPLKKSLILQLDCHSYQIKIQNRQWSVSQ
jgi:hypothetical protein